MRCFRTTRDRGSISLEGVLLAPVLILGFVFVVAVGRGAIARSAVESAARDAARQASISRTADEAETSARDSAILALRNGDLRCNPDIVVDAAGLNRPPGEYATVTVTVRCTVDLSDIAIAGIPGSLDLTATFTSPIDPYRA